MEGRRLLCQFGTEVLLPYGFVFYFVDKLRTLIHILQSNHLCRPKLSLPVLFRLFHHALDALLRGDHIPGA